MKERQREKGKREKQREGREREEGRERRRLVLLHVIVIVLSSLINLSTL